MLFMLTDVTKSINKLGNSLFLVNMNIVSTSKICKYCEFPLPLTKQNREHLVSTQLSQSPDWHGLINRFLIINTIIVIATFFTIGLFFLGDFLNFPVLFY